MPSSAVEKCPKCERQYPAPGSKDYFKHKEGDKVCYSPNDVDCPCGLTLRWIVPIFKETASGHKLVPKKDSEPKRASTEK